MRQTRLLGFVPLAGLDALLSAVRAVPGPAVHVQNAPQTGAAGYPMVAALSQDEPDVPLVGRSREALTASLQSVQRRLEVACLIGPFLPMDPATACCPSATLPRLLATAWDALAVTLAHHGAQHQWDIVLTWTPEQVVARRRGEIAPAAALGPEALAEAVGAALRNERGLREAALLAALGPAVLAFADGGAACTETQVAVTVLVKSGSEAAVEGALDGMAAGHVEGATIDMRGPQPPLSFFAVRMTSVDEQAITRAWTRLGLPDRIDLPGLHRQWRTRAAAVHPDRQPVAAVAAAATTVSDLTAAYRLLRDLLSQEADAAGHMPATDPTRHTLNSLLRHAGHRLVMPADTTPLRTGGLAPEPVLELLP